MLYAVDFRYNIQLLQHTPDQHETCLLITPTVRVGAAQLAHVRVESRAVAARAVLTRVQTCAEFGGWSPQHEMMYPCMSGQCLVVFAAVTAVSSSLQACGQPLCLRVGGSPTRCASLATKPARADPFAPASTWRCTGCTSGQSPPLPPPPPPHPLTPTTSTSGPTPSSLCCASPSHFSCMTPRTMPVRVRGAAAALVHSLCLS